MSINQTTRKPKQRSNISTINNGEKYYNKREKKLKVYSGTLNFLQIVTQYCKNVKNGANKYPVGRM